MKNKVSIVQISILNVIPAFLSLWNWAHQLDFFLTLLHLVHLVIHTLTCKNILSEQNLLNINCYELINLLREAF